MISSTTDATMCTEIWGCEFRGLGFGFRVTGFGLRVSSYGFLVCKSKISTLQFVIRNS